MNDAFADNQGQFSLNRMLKRKFTELEEITERLRARLLDVTDETDDIDKDDMEDEFESDLNTQPNEEEDGDDWSFVDENIESSDNTFSWSQLCKAAAAAATVPTIRSSSSILTNSLITDDTAQDNVQSIAQALGNSELTEKNNGIGESTTAKTTIVVKQTPETSP